MEIVKCSIADYDEIIRDIADFWGSDRTVHLHQPFLIHEFGNTAFVIKENNSVAAYLFGFFSQTENSAYIHLIGVRENQQRKGMGIQLYQHFIQLSKAKGIKKIKAITTTTNKKSIVFHTTKIGMRMMGTTNETGIQIVKNYSGPGMDRVVFEKEI